MSIQLVYNTLFGVYGQKGVEVIQELQAFVQPQSWQLDYIPETGKFSILGCSPTVNKQEIEAIFARRTQYPLFETKILDSFYYGNRQFILTPPPDPIMHLKAVARAALDSPLDERARRFLAPTLERARQISPEEPAIQLSITAQEVSPGYRAVIERVLKESNARVVLTWT